MSRRPQKKIMAWPIFTFGRRGFSRFNLFVMIIDWVTLTLAVCILLKAIDIRMNLGHFINMISSKDGDILPIILAVVAIQAIPVQVISIVLHLNIIYGGQKPGRQVMRNWLLGLVFGGLWVAKCAGAVILVSVVHTRDLQGIARNGIAANMEDYGQGGSKQIDLLQTRFQCCGSASYREWFNIRWDSHMMEKTSKEHEVSDDVPYSCCLQSSMTPCVHNNIKSVSNVYMYDPRHDLTVSQVGCHERLVEETRRIVRHISVVLGVFTVLQVVLAACRRVEQTVLRQSQTTDARDVYRGWIFGTFV